MPALLRFQRDDACRRFGRLPPTLPETLRCSVRARARRAIRFLRRAWLSADSLMRNRNARGSELAAVRV